ncbi:TOX high mobility group box family member 4 [Zonotrichia leucophrys gambelii]|uniref:TOX high mobility group box family member 4 n=1 Tax=Zonotrichia leucophrys gambelii TaxID=257770 RepID=UPI003140C675
MEFPGGSDNYLAITGTSHPFLSGAETFHTPSLGDEEFEIPPIPLDSDPSLAVVGTFEELPEPGGAAAAPFAPPGYGVGGLELPVAVGLPPGIMEQPAALLNMELEPPMGSQFPPSAPVTIEVPLGALSPAALLATPLATPLTTIDQSELSSQLGLGLGGAAAASATPPGAGPAPQAPPSPERGLSPGPSPAGSLQDEEMEEFRRPPPAAPSPPPAPPAAPPEPPRRAKPPKKAKKKKDPNEPQKPVSAYALFFRDTQAAIKGQNPNATFGEVSKIVASMWDSLGEEQKQVYKRKTEAAKKEYLKALTAYKATLTSTDPPEPDPAPTAQAPPPSPSPAPQAPPPAASPAPQAPPPITKILIPKQLLLGGAVGEGPAGGGASGGVVTVIPVSPAPSSAPRPAPPALARLQPPPLTQMPLPPPSVTSPPGAAATPPPSPAPPPSAAPPPPPPLQQGPPKIRAPPPLHIKVLAPPPLHVVGVASAPAPPPAVAQPLPQAGHANEGGGEEEEEEREGGAELVLQAEAESPPRVELVAEVAEVGAELGAESPPGGGGASWPRGRSCVRAGCERAPVASGDWDEEFCSSECLVRHCRDVFLAWLAARGSGSGGSVVFVK